MRINLHEANKIVEAFENLPKWGVVSTFACDVLYDGLTYKQAQEFAEKERLRPGTDCKIVLIFDELPTRNPLS